MKFRKMFVLSTLVLIAAATVLWATTRKQDSGPSSALIQKQVIECIDCSSPPYGLPTSLTFEFSGSCVDKPGGSCTDSGGDGYSVTGIWCPDNCDYEDLCGNVVKPVQSTSSGPWIPYFFIKLLCGDSTGYVAGLVFVSSLTMNGDGTFTLAALQQGVGFTTDSSNPGCGCEGDSITPVSITGSNAQLVTSSRKKPRQTEEPPPAKKTKG